MRSGRKRNVFGATAVMRFTIPFRSLDSGGAGMEQYEKVKKKQAASSFPYFFGSVILIVTAIVATAILNRTSNTEVVQDIRTRASVTSLMRMTAVVTSVDESKGVVIVNGLQFAGSAPESLEGRNTAGEWTVNVVGNTNLGGLSPGRRVELQVNPASFNIAQRSLTAAAITISQ